MFHEKSSLQFRYRSAFPGVNHCTSLYSRWPVCILPILSHRILKQMCIQGSRFNETVIFFCFIKDILKWSWLFYFVTAGTLWWRSQWLPAQFHVTSLICAQVPAVHPTLLLYHHCKCQPRERGKEHLSIIMKIVVTLMTPGKVLKATQGSVKNGLITAALD